MIASIILITSMAFFILSPVLNIEGHFIYPPELFVYVLVVWRVFLCVIGRSTSTDTGLIRDSVKANTVYASLFLCNALFTAYLADQQLNNYDLFIFRNILQVVLCVKLFNYEFKKIEKNGHLDLVIFSVILVLCVPAIIVFMQRLDVLGLRNSIIDMYKTQFFFLGRETFSAYRYASVFKDFFTAAVYFTMLSSLIFYFSLKTTLGVYYRLCLIALIVLVYGSQLFVARSSLVMIPVLICVISLFGSSLRISVIFKRILPMLFLVVVIGTLASQYIFESGLVNKKWAIEAHTFTTDKSQTSSSYDVMQKWYVNYFTNMDNNKYSLFRPRHIYDLTERKAPGLYTDSFYGQELYRYGIYGIAAYLLYLILMIWTHWPRNRFIIILVIALAVLNYKGGNTFFMPKNIYLFAFILVAIPFIENRRSNSVANSFSDASVTTPTR